MNAEQPRRDQTDGADDSATASRREITRDVDGAHDVRGGLAAAAGSKQARRVVATIGIAVLVGVAILVSKSSSSTKGKSAASSPGATTTVERRTLIATDTESGTLGFADPYTVFDRMGGTVTRLPRVGQLIKPGGALYEIDETPVVLFSGSTPAHRDLTPSDSRGADVLELNRNLGALGFDPAHLLSVNPVWQAATTSAVESWQASLGEKRTGTIPLGQVVFLPGAQRITSVDSLLGAPGASAASASASASSRPSASSADEGGQPILQTSSTEAIVSVALDATKQGEAVVGASVTVQMPDGRTMNGRIARVGAVAQTSTTSSSSAAPSGTSEPATATIPVTIKPVGVGRLAGLDQATVSVEFHREEEKKALSVPVTALLATAGGGYAVQLAISPHRLIAVTPGLFAAGYVQITGPQLQAGMHVTDSQG
jgi:hypothetical protein